jgi:hypothetical protein
MHTYKEMLEDAKKRIQESNISEEDKKFLEELVPKLSFDMLEVFIWTIEEDSGNTSTIVEKTHRLIKTATDSVEMKKAVANDKKELEKLIASENVVEEA